MKKVFESFSIFKIRDYSLFWAARVLGTLGMFMQSVTIGWQVYSTARQTMDVPHSSFLLGMIGLAHFIPQIALTLLAGATVDKYDRKKILQLTTSIQVGCLVILAAEALAPRQNLYVIFSCALLFGSTRAFLLPASASLGPMIVTPTLLPRAIAWNALSVQTGMVIGPWIGGMLCAFSVPISYAVAAMMYMASLIALSFIRANTKPQHNGGSRLALIKEGLHYVWNNKLVFGAISLDLFAVLLGGVTALLPVFAKDILNIGADGFGLLRSGPAMGGATMAIFLSVHPIERHAGRFMLGAVAVFGVATIVFSLSREVWLSMAALITLGGADVISVFVRQTLVQIVTPDAMRGRVAAVSSLFISASNELGEFESGTLSRMVGPVASAFIGGLGSIIITIMWARMFPALRKADRLHQL